MPFLTRDFAVFLGIVTFLVGGIFVTVTEDYFSNSQVASVVQFADTEVDEYQVEESISTPNERPARLAELKDKVAKYMKSVVVIEKSEPEVVKEEETEPVKEDSGVLVCSNYLTYGGLWNPSGLKFEVVEGARLVYREITSVQKIASDMSASTTLDLAPDREIVAQLPLRSFPNKQPSCIGSDVIGIATDGSLIRNNELSLYKVFGSETLIGYTLDGYALYGQGESDLDKCGGKTVAGEYRYYLDIKSEGVIGCYSGTPIKL
jgi:hypothetical protein